MGWMTLGKGERESARQIIDFAFDVLRGTSTFIRTDVASEGKKREKEKKDTKNLDASRDKLVNAVFCVRKARRLLMCAFVCWCKDTRTLICACLHSRVYYFCSTDNLREIESLFLSTHVDQRMHTRFDFPSEIKGVHWHVRTKWLSIKQNQLSLHDDDRFVSSMINIYYLETFFLFLFLISQHLWTRVFRKSWEYRDVTQTNKQNE